MRREGNPSSNSLIDAIAGNYNPQRCGEIDVVFTPHWFLRDQEGEPAARTSR